MKFDMKNWKKIAESPEHSTLRNQMGHEMKIAKAPLSKELRSQLESIPLHSDTPTAKLADGGAVDQDLMTSDDPQAARQAQGLQQLEAQGAEAVGKNMDAKVQKNREYGEKLKSGDINGAQDIASEQGNQLAMGTMAPQEGPAVKLAKDAIAKGPEAIQQIIQAWNATEMSPSHRAYQMLAKALNQSKGVKYANGGQVNPKLAESKKSPSKPYYADGTGDVQPSDPGAVTDTGDSTPQSPTSSSPPAPTPPPETQAQDASAAKADDMLAKKRQLYNIRVAQNNIGPDGDVSSSQLDSMFGPDGEAPSKFDSNSWQQATQDYDSNQRNQAVQATQNISRIQTENVSRAQAGLPPLPVPEAAQQGVQQAVTQTTQNGGVPPTQSPNQGAGNDPMMIGQQQAAFQSAVQNKQGAALSGQEADVATAKATSDAYRQQVAAYQKAYNTYQQHYNDLNSEYKNFVDDIQKQHIQPKQLFSGMDLPQRIGASIGLLLGGFAGPGNNPVLKTMQTNIDRDIDAQKADLGKKQNLLAANMHMFGNLNDAARMTQVQMAGLAMAQLGQAAAKAGTQRATQNYLNANAEIQQNMIMPNIQNLAIRKMMSGMSGGNNNPNDMGAAIQAIRMANPDMAKSLESRYIPGVGLAQIPVSEKSRDEVLKINNFQNLLHQASQLQSEVGSTGALSPVSRAKATQLHNDLISSYNDVKGLNRFTGNEESLYDKIVPNLANNISSATGANAAILGQLTKSVTQKKNLIYTELGLPADKVITQSPPVQKKNP